MIQPFPQATDQPWGAWGTGARAEARAGARGGSQSGGSRSRYTPLTASNGIGFTSPPGEAAAAFCQHFSDHTGTGTATPFVLPPHGARAPPRPPPGPAMQGESRGAGRGRRRAHTPPSLLPWSRLWDWGREGTGRRCPGGRRKSSLEACWGALERGRRGPRPPDWAGRVSGTLSVRGPRVQMSSGGGRDGKGGWAGMRQPLQQSPASGWGCL